MKTIAETKFKQTELGMVPEDWEVVKIDDALSKIIDYRGKTPKKSNSGIRTLSAKSIKHGRIDYDHTFFISEETYKEWERRGAPEIGDVLLTTEGPLGEVAQLDKRDVAIAQRLLTLRGKERELDNSYLKYALMSPMGQHELLSRATGTTVQGIKQSEFRKILILKPSFEEQIAIAKTLSDLDSKIELNQQMNKTLEAMGRAIFKHWFIDFEFPTKDRKPFKSLGGKMVYDGDLGKEIPNGWKVLALGEVCELLYGEGLTEDSRQNGSIPVYGSNGQVGWHNKALAKGPGIVVGRKGNPGIITWVQTDFFPIDTTFYVVPKGPVRSMHYLFYILSSLDLPSLASDTAVPGLNRNIAYTTKLLVPPADLLNEFDRSADPLALKVHENNRQSGVLGALRDGLLPKLMSGKIRVPG
jgi:type I restriction enzyme S subunit